MRKMLASAALMGALMISAAHADPIKLKLSYFTSDQSRVYIASAKPLVDAVNAEGKGRLEIVPYFSGAISPIQTEQPTVVADGRADLAVILPSYSPELFPDISVLQLPGLFHDAQEATYVFRQLADKGALEGFKDFIVLGAVMPPQEIINTRTKTASLADLKGQTIRVSSPIEGDVVRGLGATPLFLPIKDTMDSLAQGKIDGAAIPPFMLFEFGIGRLTSQHFLIRTGGVPNALIMNRKKFESLPAEDQALIRKYSGESFDKLAIGNILALNKDVFAQIGADPHRTVVSPSPADQTESQRVFDHVIDEWAKAQPHNQALLALAREEIANYRKTQ